MFNDACLHFVFTKKEVLKKSHFKLFQRSVHTYQFSLLYQYAMLVFRFFEVREKNIANSNIYMHYINFFHFMDLCMYSLKISTYFLTFERFSVTETFDFSHKLSNSGSRSGKAGRAPESLHKEITNET